MAATKENGGKKRTVVHCGPDALSKFRKHVALAQANGESDRTLISSVEEAMAMFNAKMVKKYGEPKRNTKLRPGRRLSTE